MTAIRLELRTADDARHALRQAGAVCRPGKSGSEVWKLGAATIRFPLDIDHRTNGRGRLNLLAEVRRTLRAHYAAHPIAPEVVDVMPASRPLIRPKLRAAPSPEVEPVEPVVSEPPIEPTSEIPPVESEPALEDIAAAVLAETASEPESTVRPMADMPEDADQNARALRVIWGMGTMRYTFEQVKTAARQWGADVSDAALSVNLYYLRQGDLVRVESAEPRPGGGLPIQWYVNTPGWLASANPEGDVDAARKLAYESKRDAVRSGATRIEQQGVSPDDARVLAVLDSRVRKRQFAVTTLNQHAPRAALRRVIPRLIAAGLFTYPDAQQEMLMRTPAYSLDAAIAAVLREPADDPLPVTAAVAPVTPNGRRGHVLERLLGLPPDDLPRVATVEEEEGRSTPPPVPVGDLLAWMAELEQRRAEVTAQAAEIATLRARLAEVEPAAARWAAFEAAAARLRSQNPEPKKKEKPR